MSELFPWDFHSDLDRDRLISLAHLIAQGRDDALERHNPSIGDDGWTLGCSAFQFARFRINGAAGKEGYEWLSIVDSSKQLIFRVGSVPLRFFTGEADAPSERTLRKVYSELLQLSFAFGKTEGADLAYRFAVETDYDGAITSIKVVGLSGEQSKFCWDVPYREAVPAVSLRPDLGVDLPKPSVRVPEEREDKRA